MIDFWKRWHITLTNFITTYIYTPIVRSFNQLTFNNAMVATVITFLIAGLWHGASWMFVIFGGLNGLGIVVNHYWHKKIKIKINKILAWLITFNFVNITFVFFRAKEWNDAIKVLESMFSFRNIVMPIGLENKLFFLADIGIRFEASYLSNINGNSRTALFILFGLFIVLTFKNSTQLIDNLKFNFRTILLSGIAFIYAILSLNKVSEFLYFNF